MSRAVRHHIVPRRYLERFSKDGRVSVTRFGASPRHESVINATVVKNFYTLTDSDGALTDEFEKWLADTEQKLYPAFESIDEDVWPLSPRDRDRLSLWLSVQYLRTAAIRSLNDQVSKVILEDEFSAERLRELENAFRERHPKAGDAVIRDAVHMVRKGFVASASSRWSQVEVIPRYADGIAQSLR